jgi:hypothetical protein
MRVNADLNVTTGNLHVGELSWGESITSVPADIDVVLAADCVYFEPAFPLLVQTLCELAPVGKAMELLFCWKKRRKVSVIVQRVEGALSLTIILQADKRFFMMLKKHFDSEIVDDDKPGARETYQREGVTLLRLKRKK